MKRKTTLWLAMILLSIMPALAQAPTAKLNGHAQIPLVCQWPTHRQTVEGYRRKRCQVHLHRRCKWRLHRRRNCSRNEYYVTLFNAEGKDVDQFLTSSSRLVPRHSGF